MGNVSTTVFGHIFGYRDQSTRSDNKKATQSDRVKPVWNWKLENGAKETRTPDPLHAMQVLYQLSYGPNTSRKPWLTRRRVEAYNAMAPRLQ